MACLEGSDDKSLLEWPLEVSPLRSERAPRRRGDPAKGEKEEQRGESGGGGIPVRGHTQLRSKTNGDPRLIAGSPLLSCRTNVGLMDPRLPDSMLPRARERVNVNTAAYARPMGR